MTILHSSFRQRALASAFVLTFSAALTLPAGPARAVVFYGTGDPSHNITAPGGGLLGSGWQWQGDWNGFLGTAIAPQFFITAKHIGGTDGATFTLNSVSYITDYHVNDPASDLAIWHVTTPFPDYAPLYTGSSEVGEDMVIFGRGTQRGGDVTVSSVLKGWFWGAADGVQRWGQNTVRNIDSGGPGLGDLLVASFDSTGGPEEATLSVGDSGGGDFIDDGGVWKLAGINYAVTGPFNDTNAGPGFSASIFDARGLYLQDNLNVWQQVPPSIPDQVPGEMASTRISTASNLAFIQSVAGVPEPTGLLPLGAALLLFGRRRRR